MSEELKNTIKDMEEAVKKYSEKGMIMDVLFWNAIIGRLKKELKL